MGQLPVLRYAKFSEIIKATQSKFSIMLFLRMKVLLLRCQRKFLFRCLGRFPLDCPSCTCFIMACNKGTFLHHDYCVQVHHDYKYY